MRTMTRFVALGTIVPLVSGCAFFRAVTFQSDPQSFKTEESKVVVAYYRPEAGKACKDGPSKEEFAVAGLAALAVPFVIDFVSGQIQSYLDKKKKEFTATYNGSLNAPYYYHRAGKDDYSAISFTCLTVLRTVKDGENAAAPALQWIATLVPNDSGTALRIQTDVLKLSRAAARTDSTNRKVDVSVELKFDVTTINDKGEIITTTIVDKTLAFPGVKIDEAANRTATSNWFPAIPRSKAEIARCEEFQPPRASENARCQGVSSTTISVLVTEVGSGGDAFGELSKQIGDNKKSIEDAVGKAITDALTPKASGGTSKPK